MVVDGRSYGKIKSGTSMTIDLPVGHHRLELVAASFPQPFVVHGEVDIAPRKQTQVEVWPTAWGWKAEIL